MKSSRLIVLGILGLVLAVGLTGCKIISASPDPDQVIEMRPGEKMIFKVKGPVNTGLTFCEWESHRCCGQYEILADGVNQIEFSVNPSSEAANKITITAVSYYKYFDPLYMHPWFDIEADRREWTIRILQGAPPVWQGDYCIEDSTDMQLLKGYTKVTGTLRINDRNIKNLEGLKNLASVGGLVIEHCDTLTSLYGLENITSLGGILFIWGNKLLTSLTGLENLTLVGGALWIEDCHALTSLTSLENLTSVGGDLYINWNNALTNLAGLENIRSVGGDLGIMNNDALKSLGMAALQNVGSHFLIYSNPMLCSFFAEELRDQVLSGGGIGGQIEIEGNKDCTTP
jgi:hypothetical protein